MKFSYYSILVLLLVSFNGFSQANQKVFDKNIIKFNLTSLPFNNYELQYERLLMKKISLTLSGRVQPYGGLPAFKTVQSFLNKPDFTNDLEKIKMWNQVITSELRFYLGKKPGARGFYLAPFARYSNIRVDFNGFEFDFADISAPVDFSYSKQVNFKGNIRGITGGLMLGSQWRLGKSIYLDWWIIGASIGKSKGSIDGLVALDQNEQDFVREELENLDIPFVNYDLKISDTGVKMKFNGSFATLRSGIAIGLKF
jgi:hypothetical protein